MERFSFFLISLTMLLSSCGGGKGKLLLPDSSRWTDQDIPIEEIQTGSVNTDSINIADQMKKLFSPSDSLIEGRPVSFYLDRRDVSTAAKNFYLLRLIPTIDNPEIYAICDSLMTKNDTTRPFYYFLFLRFFKLGGEWDDPEILPGYAVEYSMQFVDEFYKKLEMPQYKWSYPHWVHAISLNKISTDDIRSYLINVQTKNAKKTTKELRQKIAAFADSIVRHNLEN